MLEKDFSSIYTKFKMSLYAKIFSQEEKSEKSDRKLSAIEVICVELIYALGRPTVNQFSKFAQLSAPNAAYKVNSLMRKGYVRKVQNPTDKREFYLEVTDKYMEDYGITYDYINTVMQRIRQRFSAEDVAKLEEILTVLDQESMPEVRLNVKK